MKTILCLMTVAVCLCGTITAQPTLDTLVPFEDPIGPSPVNLVYLTDLTEPETSISQLVLETTGYENKFGLYNPLDPTKRLLLIDGEDADPSVNSITEVEFDLVTGRATITSSYDPALEGTSEIIAAPVGGFNNVFGFYPENEGTIFYTNENLNHDGFDHGLIYDPGGAYVYVVWEDTLNGGGNMDYNDMVVRVSDVAVVPAPASILLGCLGAGMVGWLKRKCSLLR